MLSWQLYKFHLPGNAQVNGLLVEYIASTDQQFSHIAKSSFFYRDGVPIQFPGDDLAGIGISLESQSCIAVHSDASERRKQFTLQPLPRFGFALCIIRLVPVAANGHQETAFQQGIFGHIFHRLNHHSKPFGVTNGLLLFLLQFGKAVGWALPTNKRAGIGALFHRRLTQP